MSFGIRALLPAVLGGLYLSGSATTPKITQIPPLSYIAPKGFTKFIADNTSLGFNHVNFKLSSGGDNVFLTALERLHDHHLR